jgi:hypothetical protein
VDRGQASAGYVVKIVVERRWLSLTSPLRYRSPAAWRSPAHQNRGRRRQPQLACGKGRRNQYSLSQSTRPEKWLHFQLRTTSRDGAGGGRTFRTEGKLPASGRLPSPASLRPLANSRMSRRPKRLQQGIGRVDPQGQAVEVAHRACWRLTIRYRTRAAGSSAGRYR